MYHTINKAVTLVCIQCKIGLCHILFIIVDWYGLHTVFAKSLSHLSDNEDCVAVSCHPGKKIDGLFGAIKDMVPALFCKSISPVFQASRWLVALQLPHLLCRRTPF